MKVKNTFTFDSLYARLPEKIRSMMAETPYLHVNHGESICIIKQYFPSWQYNGSAPFEEVATWCEQHLGDDWVWNFETIYFKREQDRAVFLLRWA